MLDLVKEWANSLLSLGIFTSIVEISLPKGNIKKYIYVIIGVVTIITIISPFISKEDYEDLASNAIETISKEVDVSSQSSNNVINSEEYVVYQTNMVKNEYINNLKKSIWNDLTKKGVILNDITITITEDYTVNKLEINVKEYSEDEYTNKSQIVGYIKKYYEIKDKNIKIIESSDKSE